MASLDLLRNACIKLIDLAETYLDKDGGPNRDLSDADVEWYVEAVNRFRRSFRDPIER